MNNKARRDISRLVFAKRFYLRGCAIYIYIYIYIDDVSSGPFDICASEEDIIRAT